MSDLNSAAQNDKKEKKRKENDFGLNPSGICDETVFHF